MNNKFNKDLTSSYDPIVGITGINRLDALFNSMQHVMDACWANNSLSADTFKLLQPKSNFPKVNVSETDKGYEVEIAVSGFDRDNLELEFKDSYLFIKANKTEEKEEENKRWLTREISNKSFRRTIQFPSKIIVDEIKSKYDDSRGLVVCVLPKKTQEEVTVKKINIE